MIGTSVSHYRIEAQLGQGGMGIVYRAVDTRLERPVALKFLPPHLSADPEAKARFVREAKAASSLDHPNICPVYDIGETDDGRLFMVMPFYAGDTLKYRIGEGPLEVGRAVGIAVQIAAGLGRAHEAGIVHRDVKPANIMVTDRHEVKILDFGVAKLEESNDLTRVGSTVGTAAYMSPEQAQGGTVDGRSDLWSLGVLLYEMLTGKRPFEAGYEQAVLYAILNQDPEPVDSLSTGVPADVLDMVRRLLAKDATARPASANDVITVLAPHAQLPTGSHVTASAGSATATVPSVHASPSRSPRVLVMAVAATVVAIGAVALGLWLASKPGTTEPTLSADRIAVFPFTVNGDPALAYLGEGMVNLLGTKLDGAGTLHTVDPNATVGTTHDFSDRAMTPGEARLVAAGLGAGSFVLGSVTKLADQIQFDAALYGPADTMRARVTVEGEDRMPQGVDELARELISRRLSADVRGMQSVAALTTSSFSALKAYLEGEASFHDLDYDAAHDALKRAIAADSNFALAWYRLARAIRWGGGDYSTGELVVERRAALDRALANRTALPSRYQTLIEAADAFEQGDVKRAEELYRQRLEREPDDVEALSELMDFKWSYNPLSGKSAQEAAPVALRLLGVDRDNRDALWVLGALAAQREDWPAFDSVTVRMMDLLRDDDTEVARNRIQMMTAYRALVLDPEASVAAVMDSIENVNFQMSLAANLVGYARRFDEGEQVVRRLDSPDLSEQTRQTAGMWLAGIDVMRGRPRAADDGFTDTGRWDAEWLVERVMRDAVPGFDAPRERLLALREEVAAWDTTESHLDPHSVVQNHYGEVQAYLHGILDIRLDDDESLARELAYLRARPEANQEGEPAFVFAKTLESLKAWRDGAFDVALNGFDNAQLYVNDVCAVCSNAHSQTLNRYARAEILFVQNRLDEAERWYASLFDGDQWWGMTHLGFTYLREAAIAESRGDLDRAADRYGRFTDLWRNAEPEFQPMVVEAQSRLEELLAGGAQEPGTTVTPRS